MGLTLTRPEHPESAEKIDVSELVAALMAWGQISPRASYLVELDMAKQTTETWTGRESDQRLAPVRLYLEYTANDLLRLRLGRFLTPLGQWNEHHAEPLTWTPTRPLTTYRPFAKSLTGVMLAGEGPLKGKDAGYALFWAPSASLDRSFDEAEESAFARALGGRVAMEVRPGLTLGLDAAMVRRAQPLETEEGIYYSRTLTSGPMPAESEDHDEGEEREEEAHGRGLLGADVRWVHPSVELTAEATWLPASEHAASEGGVFAQGAFRMSGPLWAVARVETYTPVDGDRVRMGFVGLTLRPAPRFVVKTGWQFAENPSTRIPDGWFLSFSSLF